MKDHFAEKHLVNRNMIRRAIIGAIIGLVFISLFLVKGGEGDPSWPQYWWIRPLVVVPAAGAAGGIFWHILAPMRALGGWKSVTGFILSVLGFIVCLWLGSVAGLDGTYWD